MSFSKWTLSDYNQNKSVWNTIRIHLPFHLHNWDDTFWSHRIISRVFYKPQLLYWHCNKCILKVLFNRMTFKSVKCSKNIFHKIRWLFDSAFPVGLEPGHLSQCSDWTMVCKMWSSIPCRNMTFLFSKMPRLDRTPTRLALLWVPGFISMGVKKLRCKPLHTHPYNTEVNTMRTGNRDLRFYITTVQDRWRKSAFLTRACFPCKIHLIMQYIEPVSEWSCWRMFVKTWPHSELIFRHRATSI